MSRLNSSDLPNKINRPGISRFAQNDDPTVTPQSNQNIENLQ